MEIIVKLSTLLKPKPKRLLNQVKTLNNSLRSLNITKTSHNHGMKPRNTKNILQPLKSQMVNYQTTSTGEVLVVLITPTLIEIKVTVVHATLYLSHKLLK